VQKLYHKDSKTWHVYRVEDEDVETSSELRSDGDRKSRVIWGAGHIETEAHGGESSALLERRDSGLIVPSCGFRLKTNGRVRVVVLKHKDSIAYVICDGIYVNAVAYDHAHVQSVGSLDVYFNMKVPGERRCISAAVKMSLKKQQWDYTLTVNDLDIPMCWMSTVGYNHLAHAPEVVHPDLLPAVPVRCSNCRDLSPLLSVGLPGSMRIERMFCFSTLGHLRTVAFCRTEHGGHHWTIVLDGEMVATFAPASNGIVAFEMPVPGGKFASARAHVNWEGLRTGWVCALDVNGVPVPPSLSSDNGAFSTLYGPEVIDVEKNAIDPGEVIANYNATARSLHFVQVFQFTTQGQLRSVAISHSHCVWRVFCDGIQVQSFKHKADVLKSRMETISFEVPVQHGRALSAFATMEWHVGIISCWKYDLKVNGIPLQACWSRSEGTHCVPLLEVERPEASSKENVKFDASIELDDSITEGPIDGITISPIDGVTVGPTDDSITMTQSMTQEFEGTPHDDDLHCFDHSPYSIGEYVQYYSWSHRKWLLSIFQGRQGFTEFYIVDIVQGKRRFHVHLDCLRSPFQADELVEVFSQRKGWLPASVSGHQDPIRAMRIGYKVQLDGREGLSIDHVPSERLRRRFPAGASVEIWHGPLTGWQRTTVHEKQMSRDGCGAAPLPDSFTPAFLKSQSLASEQLMSEMEDRHAEMNGLKAAPHDRRERHMMARFIADARFHEEARQPSIESQLDPWIFVPVAQDSPSVSADMVPLYLLRDAMPETILAI